MAFSTIGTGSGGSASQVNFSITANASGTVSALYTANGIVDVAGLLVAIQNTGATSITLTAVGGSIVNSSSYTAIAGSNNVLIQPNATVVLETNLANLNYYINSYSNINSVYGGTAGQLLWQTAPSTTGFVSTGTIGQMLVSGGTGAPTWQPIAVPNVQGGLAGQVLYQSATNSTSFVPIGTTGQILSANGASAPTWLTVAGSSGVTVTNNGSTLTLKSVRSYSFAAAGMTSGQSFVTFLANGGIPDLDGNQYTIYNNTATQFTLVLPVIINYFSYNYNAGYFISGSNVYLQPNQSVNIQTYSAASSQYTIMDTSASQAWGFFSNISSMGTLPSGVDTIINYNAISDPTGAFNNTSHTFVVPKKGIWIFDAQIALNTSSVIYQANIQIRQNSNQVSIGFGQNTSTTTAQAITLRTSVALLCNVGDSINCTVYVNNSGVTPLQANPSVFSGILSK